MYKEYEITSGDIGVVTKPTSFIGRLIALFDKPHSFFLVRYYGVLYVYEMKGFGLNVVLYSDSYAKKAGWELLKPKKEYDSREIKKLETFCDALNLAGANYDTLSLIKHLYSKVTNMYPLERKDDHKYICSELCALITNYVRPFTFVLPEAVTPKHILNHYKFYKYGNN